MHDMCAGPKPPKPPYSKSGYYGVYASGKRWHAKIRYDSKNHNLGSFDTKQEAALAYDKSARQCGEDKRLNYESIAAAEEAAVQAHAEHALKPFAGCRRRPRPKSGFYGVYRNSAVGHALGWRAEIRYGGKGHHLGTFATKQEAALAYDKSSREHAEGARPLNYTTIIEAEEAAAQAQAEHILMHDMCAGPKPPKPPYSKSGYYGVYASGKRWNVLISYGGKQHCLRSYSTKQEAALVYDRASRQCGEVKSLNFESLEAGEEAAAQAQVDFIPVVVDRQAPMNAMELQVIRIIT
jgi:hypothetical protein